MWVAIGESLPFAIGLMLSPFVVVTGLMLLLGDNGRVKSALLGLGWFVAIATLTAIGFLIVDTSKDASAEATETGVYIGQLLFGILFFVLAVMAWRKRPRGDEPTDDESKKPSLTSRLDGLSPLGAFGVGAAQGFLVIKNIPLALSAGAVFGEAGLVGGQAAGAVVAFAFVGTLGVLVPLVVAVIGGERITPTLASARVWFEANMSAITITILVVLGAMFLGKGLGILG